MICGEERVDGDEEERLFLFGGDGEDETAFQISDLTSGAARSIVSLLVPKMSRDSNVTTPCVSTQQA